MEETKADNLLFVTSVIFRRNKNAFSVRNELDKSILVGGPE